MMFDLLVEICTLEGTYLHFTVLLNGCGDDAQFVRSRCSISGGILISFFKFMWLLFLIFQANFLAMEKSIEEERKKGQELLTILNKIERKIKN